MKWNKRQKENKTRKTEYRIVLTFNRNSFFFVCLSLLLRGWWKCDGKHQT